MLAKIQTSALSGVDAIPIEVEVEVRGGTPRFTIIGLADNAIRESRDRISSAIRASGFKMPGGPILVSLAPAEVKKEGSSFDISIALGILAASKQINPEVVNNVSVHGELSLDGSIKGVRGILPMALSAKTLGLEKICVPLPNVAEASLVNGLDVVGSPSLLELYKILNGESEFYPVYSDEEVRHEDSRGLNFSDIWGQERAKRALQIAASGGHNILMIGPPGCGKSMLAQAFQSLLPPLSESQLMEVIKIHSAAGLPVYPLLLKKRPFRAPHHVISDVGLVGGGANPKPGEISLAHHGVLFLDELPEYKRSALEALRAPMESGKVRIVRAGGRVEFPARFQLVAAMNPCPCGRSGINSTSCLCSLNSIHQYLKKLSQPILDRIDIHLELDPVPLSVILGKEDSKITHIEKNNETVIKAIDLQLSRQGKLNSELSSKEVTHLVSISDPQERLLSRAADKIGLSARSYVRILKVARTIADINCSPKVGTEELAEAISYRVLERLSMR